MSYWDRHRDEARHRYLDARLAALAGRGVVADVLRSPEDHFTLRDYDYLGREIEEDDDELELEIELDDFDCGYRDEEDSIDRYASAYDDDDDDFDGGEDDEDEDDKQTASRNETRGSGKQRRSH